MTSCSACNLPEAAFQNPGVVNSKAAACTQLLRAEIQGSASTICKAVQPVQNVRQQQARMHPGLHPDYLQHGGCLIEPCGSTDKRETQPAGFFLDTTQQRYCQALTRRVTCILYGTAKTHTHHTESGVSQTQAPWHGAPNKYKSLFKQVKEPWHAFAPPKHRCPAAGGWCQQVLTNPARGQLIFSSASHT